MPGIHTCWCYHSADTGRGLQHSPRAPAPGHRGNWAEDVMVTIMSDVSTCHVLPQPVPAPVLQLHHHALPGHGGLAIVCAPGGAQAVTLATLTHAPGVVRVLRVHHHGATSSGVLQRGTDLETHPMVLMLTLAFVQKSGGFGSDPHPQAPYKRTKECFML